MKLIVIFAILLNAFSGVAQDMISTEKQAREFFATAQDTAVATVTLTEEDGEFFDLFSRKKTGDIIFTGTTVFLVKEQVMATLYNYSVISLNKTTQGAEKVKKLQNEIVSQYNFGIPFKALIDKYATPETGSEERTYHYELLPEGQLKDAIPTHYPGKIYVEELSGDMVYIMVLNSPPAKQKTITLLQPLKDFPH